MVVPPLTAANRAGRGEHRSLLSHRRGGVLLRPWNLALPPSCTGGAEPRPYALLCFLLFQKLADQRVQHAQDLADIHDADHGRDAHNRQRPVGQLHHAPDLRQHQRQIQNQPRRVEVDLQQAAGRVGAQQKYQHQAQEAGQRNAPRAPQPDKAVVQNQVQHRTGQHRDQRPRAALIDHIDAVQKLVHAGQH